MKCIDKICGSFIGGAVGDALGYVVKFFLAFKSIVKNGIMKYALIDGIEQTSDDA